MVVRVTFAEGVKFYFQTGGNFSCELFYVISCFYFPFVCVIIIFYVSICFFFIYLSNLFASLFVPLFTYFYLFIYVFRFLSITHAIIFKTYGNFLPSSRAECTCYLIESIIIIFMYLPVYSFIYLSICLLRYSFLYLSPHRNSAQFASILIQSSLLKTRPETVRSISGNTTLGRILRTKTSYLPPPDTRLLRLAPLRHTRTPALPCLLNWSR